MKLFLSSQRLGNSPERLYELVGKNKNVAVIANAIDDKSESYREGRVQKEFERLEAIGLHPEELDLRNYYRDPLKLSRYFDKKSLVWIRGGNSFLLRRAMIESGFDEAALPLIRRGKLVYGGYSAALTVAGLDLFGLDKADDRYVIPPEYSFDIEPPSGLGLIDFYLIPHQDSTEPWGKPMAKYYKHLINNNRRVKTLRDGEVYLVNGDKAEVLV